MSTYEEDREADGAVVATALLQPKIDALTLELTAAQAEIGRSRAGRTNVAAMVSEFKAQHDALETKLTTLRAEVKRILDVFPQDWYAPLLAAYEASQ